MKHYISYLRVSTKMQGQSGLGLEAQRKTISDVIARNQGALLTEYIEVESGSRGKLHKRVKIQRAVQHCKETGATLIVAKLDRLARDVEFTMSVINSGIDVMFCDFPHSGKLVITIVSAVAEYEREMTSKRTKEALAAKKARGEKVGATNPDWNKNGHIHGGQAMKDKMPYTRNRKMKGHIELLVAEGLNHKQIADRLNEQGFRTTNNRKFTNYTICRILKTPQPKQ